MALPLAQDMSPARFERRLEPMIERLRDEPLEARHERAREDRCVLVAHCPDGMSTPTAVIDSVTAEAIRNRLTSIAVGLERDDAAQGRSRDQLRADVLRDLLLDGETDRLPEGVRGIRPEVAVTVPVLSLITGDDRTHGAAMVRGVGPIPIGQARLLAGAASGWLRVLTDPITSVVLDVDRKRYRPPAELARIVKWSYGTCTAPGRRVDAMRCELDHILAWEHGGSTSIGNIHPICRRHHTTKHDGR